MPKKKHPLPAMRDTPAPQPQAPDPKDAPQAPVAVEEVQAAREYVEALASGRLKPPNRYAADLLAQLRAADQELTALRRAIQEGQDRIAGLTAISQQTTLTLYRWRPDAKDG